MSLEFADLLQERLNGVVALSGMQVAALQRHYELLMKWNRVLSLTTITRLDEVVERHYCESLLTGAHLPPGVLKIVDIGSGPGFPGLPIAILRPECRVVLVESNQRKAMFLKESARGLAGVRVIAKRAEEVEEEFDWVVSRAVSIADLRGVLGRVAREGALLTGGEDPGAVPGWVWVRTVAMPWGRARFVRFGRRAVD